MARKRKRTKDWKWLQIVAAFLLGSVLTTAEVWALGRPKVVSAAQSIALSDSKAAERKDCSTYVLCSYQDAGCPIDLAPMDDSLPRSESMYRQMKKAKKLVKNPAPGDIAFFRDTCGDKKGQITHVALVEKVETDGTVLLLQRLNSGVKESRMNLAHPHDVEKNSYLKRGRAGKEPVLSGELFVAYGRP